MLHRFTINVDFYPSKDVNGYNVQITNSTFVGKKMRQSVNRYSIDYFQMISDTKYNIQLLKTLDHGQQVNIELTLCDIKQTTLEPYGRTPVSHTTPVKP